MELRQNNTDQAKDIWAQFKQSTAACYTTIGRVLHQAICPHRKGREVCYFVYPVKLKVRRHTIKTMRVKPTFLMKKYTVCPVCGKKIGRGEVAHSSLTRKTCARKIHELNTQGRDVVISSRPV